MPFFCGYLLYLLDMYVCFPCALVTPLPMWHPGQAVAFTVRTPALQATITCTNTNSCVDVANKVYTCWSDTFRCCGWRATTTYNSSNASHSTGGAFSPWSEYFSLRSCSLEYTNPPGSGRIIFKVRMLILRADACLPIYVVLNFCTEQHSRCCG